MKTYMKKKNNPWYYYLNGQLVKQPKPAKPGDLVLIDRELTSNCLFTIVSEVHIGGFHDHHGRYFKWDKVYKASKVLEELTDLRTFKEKWQDRQSSLVEYYRSELIDHDTAYNLLNDYMTELQNDKTAFISDLEATIEAMSKPLKGLMSNDEVFQSYCDGQLDTLKTVLSKVKSGYHHPDHPVKIK